MKFTRAFLFVYVRGKLISNYLISKINFLFCRTQRSVRNGLGVL